MMKRQNLGWAIIVLVIGTPILFIYLTFSNSTDCSQLVIDTYELHSGINIPEVEFVNCYYDEKSNTRISIYDLNANMDLSKFNLSSFTSQTKHLHGISLLEESEQPNNSQLYLASGTKWGNKWTYLVDDDSKRLWAELKYDN